ncbi:hypothetical protein CPB83DRAFT_861149 [Crepidotus variabilis]|uniref:DRBM domain-containing protein n=1 Tax=Crepidotus variabilis TaxID=179855 RepID=A0A9P6JLD3_9AGAR|nr:hypothetical protein CPB83DRAFT_861149 [Crepidotus variabilis]
MNMFPEPIHRLDIHCSRRYGSAVAAGLQYQQRAITGPQHAQVHDYIVLIQGVQRGSGSGPSAKAAKSEAARDALSYLQAAGELL